MQLKYCSYYIIYYYYYSFSFYYYYFCYFYSQGRGMPRYDYIVDPVTGGINAQVPVLLLMLLFSLPFCSSYFLPLRRYPWMTAQSSTPPSLSKTGTLLAK